VNNTEPILSNYKKPKRKKWKIILISVIAVLLGLGLWLGISAYSAMKKITSLSGDSLFNVFSKSSQELKGQSEGRTNILLLGMGGTNHPGGTLSDTIMVVSIDWQTKKMAMISLPRDLWVKVPGLGYSKINGAYSYGEQNSKTTGGGGEVSSKVASEVLGVPIHYFLRIDFDGFKKIVDTLGGIDVTVDKAINDPYYPAANMIDYDPFSISAGVHHLDGATALKYARSRETTSDFDRSRRQQQVIKAIKEKAMTLDVLANPKKLTDLMGIIGDHIRTNLSAGEIKSLAGAQKDLDTQNTVSQVFDTAADGPLTSTTDSRGYIILPKKGIGNYADLQEIAKNIFAKSPTEVQGATTSKANSKIEILNASNKSGVATEISNNLKKQGYTVSKIGDATTNYNYSIVYNCGGAGTQTVAQTIAKNLNFRINYKTSCGGMDIQIVAGADYLATH
jgi:LCP family protein required for cell wall assembly